MGIFDKEKKVEETVEKQTSIFDEAPVEEVVEEVQEEIIEEVTEAPVAEVVEEPVAEVAPAVEPVAEPVAAKPAPVVEPDHNEEMGIIAAGTVIHGDVSTKGHLAIAGTVEGDVNCAGNLMLTGIVNGKIECNNIVLENSTPATDITVKGSVSVKENITLNGNVKCKHISVMGSVIGNIDASGNVGLTKTATVTGDIKAGVLAIEPGAKIKGFVEVL